MPRVTAAASSPTDSTTDSRTDGPAGGPTARPGGTALPWARRHRVLLLLLAGYAVQVGLRLYLATGRYGPLVYADEIGYLIDGRSIAGGPPGQMTASAFYRGGYPLLTAPAFLISDDPHVQYRLLLAINAVFSAAVFPLVYGLLTGAMRIRRRVAGPAAFVAALYPPLVLTSLLVWAETGLYVLLLVTLFLLTRWVVAATAPARWAYPAGAGVAVGLLYTMHGRTIPVVVLLLLAVAGCGWLRRDLRAPAAAGLLAAGLTGAAGRALNHWLAARNWGGPVSESAPSPSTLLSSRVLHGAGVIVAGQFWYLMVGTLGLFLLGLIEATRRCRVRSAGAGVTAGAVGAGGPGRAGPLARLVGRLRAGVAPGTAGGPLVAVLILTITAALLVLTAVFFAPPSRPDKVTYGRYVEIVVPLLLGLGLSRLWQSTLRRAAAELAAGGVLTAAAFLAFHTYGRRMVSGAIQNCYSVLSLPSLAHSISGLEPRRVTMTAFALGAGLLLLLSWRRRWLSALGLVAVFVLSCLYTRGTLFDSTQRQVYAGGGGVVSVPGLATEQDIGYDLATLTIPSRWAYQWELGHSHFLLFNSRTGPPPPSGT